MLLEIFLDAHSSATFPLSMHTPLWNKGRDARKMHWQKDKGLEQCDNPLQFTSHVFLEVSRLHKFGDYQSWGFPFLPDTTTWLCKFLRKNCHLSVVLPHFRHSRAAPIEINSFSGVITLRLCVINLNSSPRNCMLSPKSINTQGQGQHSCMSLQLLGASKHVI